MSLVCHKQRHSYSLKRLDVLSLVAVDAGVAIVPASMASFSPQEIVYRLLEVDAARFALQFCTRPEQPSPVLSNFLAAAAGG